MGDVVTKSKAEVELEEKEAEKKKIITKRKKEYGKPESQLENIIEAINEGVDPMQAIKDEAERVRKIKEKHPKE